MSTMWAPLAAACLLSFAGPALAADYDLGTVTPDGETSGLTVVGQSYDPTDRFYFELNTATPAQLTFHYREDYNLGYNISQIDISLFEVAQPDVQIGDTKGFVILPGLSGAVAFYDVQSAGDYYIELTSTYTGSQVQYEAGISALAQAGTTAAPEPSSWMLMLAGVGLAGVALRASRRACALPA